MRKGLFASSTALNQLKLMCNMLGRPDEASWFRGRRGGHVITTWPLGWGGREECALQMCRALQIYIYIYIDLLR